MQCFLGYFSVDESVLISLPLCCSRTASLQDLEEFISSTNLGISMPCTLWSGLSWRRRLGKGYLCFFVLKVDVCSHLHSVSYEAHFNCLMSALLEFLQSYHVNILHRRHGQNFRELTSFLNSQQCFMNRIFENELFYYFTKNNNKLY